MSLLIFDFNFGRYEACVLQVARKYQNEATWRLRVALGLP